MKRILSTLLIFVLLISAVPISLTASANTTDFAGGSGTEADPYLISTKYHLDNVRKYLSAHFKMIADIEFTDADFAEGGDFYNGGEGWLPIGKSQYSVFTGSFNGDDHIIKNLYIKILSSSPATYNGLFGYNQGVVENLGMVDGNVSVSSSSSYYNVYAGSIVGYNKSGTIVNCYNTGHVSANQSTPSDDDIIFYEVYAGGIVGYNHSNGTVTNCHNTGTVSASASTSHSMSSAGGIVGYNYNGTITTCYNTGAVSDSASNSDSRAGGIVGHNNKGTIKSCYSTGTVSASASKYFVSSSYSYGAYAYAGGITGDNADTIINCYNAGKVSASSSGGDILVGGIAGRNDSKGTIENCYNTRTVSTLPPNLNGNCDAYAGGIVGYNDGIITNCHNTGYVSMTVESSSSSSAVDYNAYAGGIVGYNDGTIINCYNTSYVMTTFTSSSYSSSPHTNAYVGGIAGDNAGTITNCYNAGDLTTSATETDTVYAGGIVGYNDGTITNCYNTGKEWAFASYRAYAGGIVGYNKSGTIINCYNTGAVSAETESTYPSYVRCTYTGGIAGYSESDVITNCYYIDIFSEGVGNGTDTTTKCTMGKMKDQLTYVGFDFDDVWTMAWKACYPYPALKDVALTLHTRQPTFDTNNHFDQCSVCGDVINGKPHVFENACDNTCDCGFIRTITHDHQPTYDTENHFDKCTVCGDVANIKAHEFENTCDTACACGYVRSTTHSYGKYIYNNDATTKKDGTKTRTCSICGDKQTVTAKGTKIQSNPFKDVKKSDFYYTPVLWAVEKGITSGTSKTTFAPNEACTRGQIATFLWRAAGQPTPKTSKNPFTDVKKSDYYYKAVLWAVGEGITSGTSKTTFGPNEACTRGQIATFLWRANGGKKVSATNPFKDVKKSDYYYNAVLWAVKNKITSGTSATTFSPNEACTRGQIATFLYRNYN